MATPSLTGIDNTAQFTTTAEQKWFCCGETGESGITQNEHCTPVNNFTAKISNISNVTCFNTGWYSTVDGQIQYYQTEGGAYYTTKGGETYYTTGTGNLIPKLDPQKIANDIQLAVTYTYFTQTIYGKKSRSSHLNGGGSDQPLLDFKTGIFRIKNGSKTYYDYKKDDDVQFLINFHDYNIRNYIKNGNYFEVKGGTGFIDSITNESTRLMTPYCGVFPHTINILTTLVSAKLIEITLKTCSLKNYNKNLTLYSSLLLIPYIKKMICQICKTYKMNWNNPEDKKMILFMIKYTNSQNPYLLILFENWYLNEFEPINIYALQLSVKITFFLTELEQALAKLNVQMNDDIRDAFYKMIWDYMFGYKKLTIKKLNDIFRVFANGNDVFSQHFCCIVKKWFGIINNTTSMIDLTHIEVGTKTMTQEELYNASTCPEHLLYYKNLLQLHFDILTVKVRLHQYIVDIGTAALEANGNALPDNEKLAIIEHGLEERIKRILG